MRLISESKSYKLPIQLKRYNTFFKRLRGLMFRVKPIVNEGIVIEPCNSIHMFFMFFSIDVIFLNSQNEIIFLKENVKPWTVIFPIKNAKSAVELPCGSISTYNIKMGDIIKF